MFLYPHDNILQRLLFVHFTHTIIIAEYILIYVILIAELVKERTEEAQVAKNRIKI